MKSEARFVDNRTIEVINYRGEESYVTTLLPVVPLEEQQDFANLLASYYDKDYSLYDIQCRMVIQTGVSIFGASTDYSTERKRIGAKIRQLREEKELEAKQLARMANIDPANLSRIEQGKYSVGLDILTKISQVLGMKVDLVHMDIEQSTKTEQ
ncbi:MAG: helix-turn-helix transcriptional regulator [Proteiniphilum sp.]|jgi:DNA-binding XRE family transcriptional regulator|uniref:helix-turn-helix domain-containing protein n=1 Tax=Proteiniphilum sp. TaxID=1926877 RepID=UPI002B1F97D0|nr:helix-turn-helix transcriptional regulator [Proteiniphilum sp.]MEA5128316.1 helix-turn-helix transcriptional regulator [Proteiniphilum sp.]